MFTRSDYLEKKCSHRKYYAQYVTPAMWERVEWTFEIERLVSAFRQGDQHFNTFPLRQWDYIALHLPARIIKLMREAGDYPTLAGGVCILKEAALQVVEEWERSNPSK